MTLETLLGLSDDPALLDRYGPVPAALARDLATNATFRCAAADTTHGTVLGLGHGTYRDSYRPGPRLIDLTRATYRRCSFPGCRTRAIAPTGNADLDHATPWPHGPTCSCNIHSLCRPHHRLKTHGRITLEPSTNPDDPPGSYHWRLPTGHTYTARPEPVLTRLHPALVDDQPPPF